MSKKRIGIYGGSFDPPHHGHIHCAVALKERESLDEVWVIPCHKHPTKSENAPMKDRVMMTQLAFENIPGCVVLDVEDSSPSFTVETLEKLMQQNEEFREAERFLLLGSDLAEEIFSWKKYEVIEQLVRPLVLSRSERDDCMLSSTLVRSWISRNVYVEHLLPRKVLEYIRTHALYRKRK